MYVRCLDRLRGCAITLLTAVGGVVGEVRVDLGLGVKRNIATGSS